jgi:plastocyanin
MQTIARPVRILLVAAMLVIAAVFLPRLVASREPIREIRVTARNMVFHVDAIDDPNPALQLTAGEQVKVVFRNEDRGMLHDFGIPEWNVRTGTVEAGSERSVTFRVPPRAAGLSYICTPHSAMMAGRIIVSQ